MITHHDNSVAKALLDLFPNIGLDKSLLWTKTVKCMSSSCSLVVTLIFFVGLFLFADVYLITHISVWHEEAFRRKMFESYAKENGFDPLNAEMWHQQEKSKLMAMKVH